MFVLLLLGFASGAYAEHFEIQLTVSTPKDKAIAFADTFTPDKQQGMKPRPVCHAKAGDELILQFFCASNFPHDSIKNVTIRYFVVAQDKVAQDAVPARENSIMQGHFIMDFKPTAGKVGLRQKLKIDKAGVYLVRVESENSDNDHEHFAALDLIIE